MSICERFNGRQEGLGVCKEEPGRAAIATNGEPLGAGSLSSDLLRDRARHRRNAYEADTGETRDLARVLSAQTLWPGRGCSREG